MSRFSLALVVAFTALTVSSGARGELSGSLREMTVQSDVIVLGRVVDTNLRVVGGVPSTVTEVLVEDNILGATPGQRLELTTPGGTLDEVTGEVSGPYEFDGGEQMLFFGRRARAPSAARVVMVGNLPVLTTDRGGQAVQVGTRGAGMRTIDSSGEVVDPGTPVLIALPTFKADLQQVLSTRQPGALRQGSPRQSQRQPLQRTLSPQNVTAPQVSTPPTATPPADLQ